MKSVLSIAKAAFLMCALLSAGAAAAGEVEIVDARATGGGGTYAFSVTLRHGDTGWDHYADAWRVEAADGTVLGTRILHHPHEDEQPFTRSLSGVRVPPVVRTVHIRARDKLHGWTVNRYEVSLP